MPQAIFFDLDETLIRHTAPVMEQLRTICQQHLADLPEASWKVFHEHLFSNMEQLWNNVAAHRGRGEAAFAEVFRGGIERAGGDAALAEPMLEALLASVDASTCPAEGAHEVLDRLAEAGIATGIITNGFDFMQKRKAWAHGLLERVHFVLTSEDAGAHKPDARIFRMAMERVGFAAADCWHVGDNREADIAGAIGAGLGAVWYDPDRQHAAVVLPHPVPHRVISRLMEIPELIAR